jgi:hypothetical protein
MNISKAGAVVMIIIIVVVVVVNIMCILKINNQIINYKNAEQIHM